MNENETNVNTETTTIEDNTQKYIDKINDMKKNTVARSEYDKIMDENKRLLESIVNGTASVEADKVEVAAPSVQDLRNKAFGMDCEDLLDIEYIEALLDLREALIEEEGIDYGAPTGKRYTPDFNDYNSAKHVAEGLRHCLEIADGDQDVFTQELTRITNDVGIPIQKPNKKRR